MCVTVDFDTLEDHAVTVRDRDSMEQERVAIDELVGYLRGAPGLMAEPVDEPEYLRLNRAWWDERLRSTPKCDFYDLDGFVAGRDTLLDLRARGPRRRHRPRPGAPPVPHRAGRPVLGTACAGHSASTSRCQPSGPPRSLAERIGVEARFEVANVYVPVWGTYDMNYQSLGSLNWHPDTALVGVLALLHPHMTCDYD